jgi:hypothetical protein
MENFNKTHPEALEDEIWITNYWRYTKQIEVYGTIINNNKVKLLQSDQELFEPRIARGELRVGNIAYTIHGQVIADAVPLFRKVS